MRPRRKILTQNPALVGILLFASVVAWAQTESARISGRVTDPTDAVIAGAECKITNLETNVSTITTTNQDGIYVIPDLRPAAYRLTIQKEGFRTVVQPSLHLYVQDAVNENFKLALGSVSEISTVTAPLLQADSAAVSTVVDQQFVHNMPLNGRSFQSLIALTPGVVFTSQNLGQGQFSANGQYTDTNYFMVDGVSANFGVVIGGLGQSMGGALPAFTAQGGTNGLVSVDAMQEFRIQTSSYAAEYGRTPGAQISIVTKSGTNQFHGSVFDYLRNDLFDARNYFDAPPLPKPPLHQNDFGGTLGGPILKDKTFFFFSYEGLRLRQPQTASGALLTASARAAAAQVYQTILKALPLPDPNAPVIDPTCDNVTDPCMANLTVAYSNPSSLDATSIRIDHNLTSKITLFARYNHAPSYDATRYWEELGYDHANTDSFTVGATVLLASTRVNDFRANWSRNTGTYINSLSNFHGGEAPSTSVLFPPSSSYRPDTGQALVSFSFSFEEVREGTNYFNVQRQLNFVDTFSWAVGVHQFKFGIDYRRLNPTVLESTGYAVFPAYTDLVAGTTGSILLSAGDPFSVKVNNYSLFAQDTWRVTNHLTLTYGLRWEINTPPVSSTPSEPLYVIQGIFDSNPITAVPGALWHTRYRNFAPRIGAACQVTPKTVVRGGLGLFYDLGYGYAGLAAGDFPYNREEFISNDLSFNVTLPSFQPPPVSTTFDSNVLFTTAVDPNLQLPYTMQWNAAIERELGANQTLTATYLGSDGRRLLRGDVVIPPSLITSNGQVAVTTVRNAGYSHYNALQVQFQRRMSHGLQVVVSYNLAKSRDLSSTDANGLLAQSVSQIVLPSLTPSDYDIRQSIAGAISYEVPAPSWGRVGNAILRGWAVDGLVRVMSAPPINVTVDGLSPVGGFYSAQAEIVPGQPFWIPDRSQPSGKALNPAAFSQPPAGQTGDFPRNGLRTVYSINQTDVALRRRFNLTERVNFDVRAEYFNVFNHPMFGLPGSQCAPDDLWSYGGGYVNSDFGKVCSTANLDAGGGSGRTGQSALYAPGGPRSAQFTLKVIF